jgi:signal transduction histidine kinase/CheY-like chemotaxis protein
VITSLFSILGIVASTRLVGNYYDQRDSLDEYFLNHAQENLLTVTHIYTTIGDSLFASAIEQAPSVIGLAEATTEAAYLRLRAQLIRDLSTTFRSLQEAGFGPLNVYTADGMLLLSFDNPERWGGAGLRSRPSVLQTLRYGAPYRGFTSRRYCCTYSVFYPVEVDGAFVGAIELSLPSQTIRESLAAGSPGYYELIVRDSSTDSRLLTASTRGDATGSAEPFASGFTSLALGGPDDEAGAPEELRDTVRSRLPATLLGSDNFVVPVSSDEGSFAASFLQLWGSSDQSIGYLVSYTPTRTYRTLRLNTAERVTIVLISFVLAAAVIVAISRARDQAESASEAKTQFLANMSHDLRTPLNGIVGMIAALENPELPTEKRAEYVRLLKSSANSLVHLLNSVLEISRIEAQSIEMRPTPTDLNTLLIDLRDEMGMGEVARGLELRLHIDPDVPRFVVVDAVRLRQILSNVLHNALKFTNEGGVSVYITRDDGPESELWIRCQIVDTGIGIAEDDLTRVFEKFAQVDEKYSRLYGGTGLGLSIVRALTELMGGSVHLHSVLGVGTTVSLSLPMEQSDEQSVQIQRHVDDGNASPGKEIPSGLRVLLAEDDRIGRIVATELLRQQGCEVDIAEDGRVAVTKASPGGYDLILMDWQMPTMDGAEATRQLQVTWKQRGIPSTPIIGLTVSDTPEDQETLRAAGMDAFLRKPLQIASLAESVADLLTDAPIDLTVAESSFDTAEEMVDEILPIFLKQANDRINSMKESLEFDDMQGVVRQTHPLKTASRYIGAHRLGRIAAELDDAAAGRTELERESFFQGLNQLRRELDRISTWADGKREPPDLPRTS